ncbi:MAG: family 43 glycosylhydrolase [Bacteroidaceae bacterium]|nr:family 43 glycosylhydrolase [Bacteroidaceae bacterium]
MYKSTSFRSVSVHDPSVVYNDADDYFYIFGSHYIGAKSKDLRNWTVITNYYNTSYDKAFKKNTPRTVKRTLNGVTEEVDFPSFDAAAWCAHYYSNHSGATEASWVSGDQWAPDLVWNPTMNKWCYYVSLNGDFWSSVIVLMTSDNITGPYTYQGPVVMGGFIGSNTSGENTNNIAPPSYKESDLEIVMGTLSSLPSKYNKGNSNGTYWPNCIDPCVFFDEEGELWMAYGSWSGGIFMIKLDKTTGLRDYTYTFPNVNATSAQCTSDEYFGKKIAGGYYVSGEGPYIQHFGEYYYLFMSYGGFAPDGGYEMRVFRSSSPDGPYKDANGVSALFTDVNRWILNYGPNASTNRGTKLIGAMNNWGTMTTGECAQGHNSACSDAQGRNFLVCHTKFNNGTVGHSVRSYQLFLNKNGWLVTAPFQFAGETVTDDSIAAGCPFSKDEIIGEYHVLLHPYKLSHNDFEEATPGLICLNEDGTVTGDYKGTWSLTEGTAYFSIKLGSSTYNGVIVEQTLENNKSKAIAFTTVCDVKNNANNGVPVWGYKLQPKYALSLNYLNHKSDCFSASKFFSVKSNMVLQFDPVENATLTWKSSNPEVLSDDGKFNPQPESTSLTMTARMECGDYYWERDFTTVCTAASEISGDQTTGLVAYYNFDSKPTYNLYNSEHVATYGRAKSSSLVPSLESDPYYSRFGSVVHQYYGAQGSNSFVRLPNPLYGASELDGFTVSLWVNRTDGSNYYDDIWSFFNSTSATASGARLFLTGNSYIGYNDNGGNWFDVNNPNSVIVSSIGEGEWHLVTFTFSKENGYSLYLDGKAYISSKLVYSGSVEKSSFDFSQVVDFVKNTRYFYLGFGSFWGSLDAYFDDLMIYNRELTATDVKGLNTRLNLVNDFSSAAETSIETVESEEIKSSKGIYDLTGRKVTLPQKGIYIVNGKKVKY